MIKAMRTAASGMTAQQMNVDTIANNLANVNTTGFKRTKVEFQDVLYQNIKTAGSATAVGTRRPVGLSVGYGTRASATHRHFTNGDLTLTNNPLDMAISCDGFFLLPEITIPTDAMSISVGSDGIIEIAQFGQDEPVQIGQLELARFVNPSGLNALGSNLYQRTTASGDALIDVPT